MSSEVLLKGEGLTKVFTASGRIARRIAPLGAVIDVDIAISPGDRIALVGESGSGKTTLGRMLLSLSRPTSGRVLYRGGDIRDLDQAGLRRYRRSCQMVFQDPQSSLNPRRRIGPVLAEVIARNRTAPGDRVEERAADLLRRVGLRPETARAYPHNLSGGQRQRVGIARALAAEPELVVADEPVSSLDVSVRAGILRLLLDLGRERNVAFLLITHDLSTAARFAQTVLVMFGGLILEAGPVREVFYRPAHPYTRSLLAAVPKPIPGYSPGVDNWGRRARVALAAALGSSIGRRPGRPPAVPPLADAGPGHLVRPFLMDR